MQTVYLGNTLINDVMLGSQRMDDVFTNNELITDWLLIGGGGSGGNGNGVRSGGGGGAGRFVSSSILIPTGASISIDAIGAGGTGQASGNTNGNNGGTSQITILGTAYTAPGGGSGGRDAFVSFSQSGNGGAGGSGGGGGATGTANDRTSAGGANQVGTPIEGFGSDGQGKGINSGNTPGGNGGGAGGTPTGLAWVDGITYCVGGFGNSTTYGSGTAGSTYAGGIGSSTAAQGVFIIRYSGTTRASGGTITQSGGYTYHTFTTSGTFTY